MNGGIFLETVELKFQYTQKEYVQAERQYLIADKILHKYDLALATLFLVFSIVYMLVSSFSLFSIILFGTVIIVTAMGCYVYFLLPILRFKQTKKYHEEYTLTFSKDSLYFKTPSIASEMKWNIYSAIKENDDFYYLIQRPRIYTLIPKRVFKSQKERQTFEEIVQFNLNTIEHI